MCLRVRSSMHTLFKRQVAFFLNFQRIVSVIINFCLTRRSKTWTWRTKISTLYEKRCIAHFYAFRYLLRPQCKAQTIDIAFTHYPLVLHLNNKCGILWILCWTVNDNVKAICIEVFPVFFLSPMFYEQKLAAPMKTI